MWVLICFAVNFATFSREPNAIEKVAGKRTRREGAGSEIFINFIQRKKRKKKRRPFSTVHVVDDKAGESILGCGARGAWA